MVQANTVFHADIESTVINGMYGKLKLVRYMRSGNTVLVHLHSSGTTTPRNTIRVTIGPSAKRHSNGVSLVGR